MNDYLMVSVGHILKGFFDAKVGEHSKDCQGLRVAITEVGKGKTSGRNDQVCQTPSS